MKRKFKPELLPVLLGVVFAFSAPASSQDAQRLRLGAGIGNTAEGAIRSNTPTVRYLERVLPGYRFDLVPLLTINEMVSAARERKVDFIFCPASAYISLEMTLNARAIATSKGREYPTAVDGCAIFVLSDNTRIRRLADLRGMRVMPLSPDAFFGWHAAWRELKEEGIDPQRDLGELKFGGREDLVVQAVLAREVDAGILQSSTLESVYRNNASLRGKFWILPPRQDYPGVASYSNPVSGRLYPRGSFVQLPHVPDSVAEKVALALLSMDPSKDKDADRMGWAVPLSYEPVRSCMAELRLGPFRDYGKITVKGVMDRYRYESLITLSCLLILLAGITIHELRINRRLRLSEGNVREELSQRKAAEDKLLRESQLLAQATDAIVALDRDYRVTFWNPVAEELFGWPSSEAAGQSLEDLLPGSVLGLPHADLREAAKSSGTWSGEAVATTRNGKKIIFDVRFRRLLGVDGNMIGLVGAFRDMTSLREMEARFREAQKLESVGRLAGGVAHDFNNLLTVINGTAGLLLQSGAPDAGWSADVREILNAGERAAGLTAQLLAFSRKQILEPKVLDMNTVVEHVKPLLTRLLEESIRVVTNLAPDLGLVKADALQMEQVIMNLAVNARDAMPLGGTLMIETSNVELDNAYASEHLDVIPGEYILMAVSDTGAGMDREIMSRIFEPFFTTKEHGKGTGLGLATCYGIVKQSCGHIWAYSEVGTGTTFKVYLPRVRQERPADPAKPLDAHSQGKGRILVVEDQDKVGAYIQRVLESVGFEVLRAGKIEEAEQVAADNEIDLLLTDVVMPNGSGPQLARKLQKLDPALKVLYTSGYTENVIVHKGILDEGVAYIPKPFKADDLIQRVKHELSRS